MKKIIALFMVVVSLAFFTGCAVNETTSSITVSNSSDKDALNVKVGDVFIGNVLKGQTTTVYFFAEKDSSEIVVEGFEANAKWDSETQKEVKADGKIDLKLNFVYIVNLSLYDGKYKFYAYGSKTGFDTKDATSSDRVSME